MTVQLLFCRTLLPGFFQSNTQHPLCHPHRTFSPIVSLESKWCNYTVVLVQRQLGRNFFYNYGKFLYLSLGFTLREVFCKLQHFPCISNIKFPGNTFKYPDFPYISNIKFPCDTFKYPDFPYISNIKFQSDTSKYPDFLYISNIKFPSDTFKYLDFPYISNIKFQSDTFKYPDFPYISNIKFQSDSFKRAT